MQDVRCLEHEDDGDDTNGNKRQGLLVTHLTITERGRWMATRSTLAGYMSPVCLSSKVLWSHAQPLWLDGRRDVQSRNASLLDRYIIYYDICYERDLVCSIVIIYLLYASLCLIFTPGHNSQKSLDENSIRDRVSPALDPRSREHFYIFIDACLRIHGKQCSRSPILQSTS